MLRVWTLLIVTLMLAACSSAPTRRESGSAISTPHAWKPPADLPAFIDHSVGEEEISIQAMGLVGVPYRWGGNTPDSGFDCSGLVRYVVSRAARVDLPRTTSEMSLVGSSIQPDEVAPGDLIYFNTTGRPHSHVGIYVGGYRFVNAPSTGGTVRIDYISNPYWAKRFDGIRRVAGTNRPATPFDAPQLITSASPETPTAKPVAAQTANAPAAPQAVYAPASAQQTYAPTPAQATYGAAVTQPAYASTPARTAPVREQTVANVQRPLVQPGGNDAFEPPPPSRADAESQAAAEHATTIDPIAAFAQGNEGGNAAENAAPVTTETPVRDQDPSARTARVPASPASGDDPIARFANGG